jgi:hypothetical protein
MYKRYLNVDLTPKIHEIINNAQEYHDYYYSVYNFGGPSLYFHLRALGLEGEVSKSLKLEFIYGTLAAWGMHRMGKGGAKMVSFREFKESIQNIEDDLESMSTVNPLDITQQQWTKLENIFKTIKIMKSATIIVGNSKVMAHFLPSIVPPVDRRYTLNYLFGNSNIINDRNYEWQLMHKILTEFFFSNSK